MTSTQSNGEILKTDTLARVRWTVQVFTQEACVPRLLAIAAFHQSKRRLAHGKSGFRYTTVLLFPVGQLSASVVLAQALEERI
jgi:hypothetical protein